jgi:hypothetical protein
MSNKLNKEMFLMSNRKEQKDNQKGTSLSHYKTILAKNVKDNKNSELNIKPRLGLIANTLP